MCTGAGIGGMAAGRPSTAMTIATSLVDGSASQGDGAGDARGRRALGYGADIGGRGAELPRLQREQGPAYTPSCVPSAFLAGKARP